MSEICIINLKKNSMNYQDMNSLATCLVKIALKNGVSVFFNSYDYGTELIKNNEMHNFFLMSDSFLYKNCGFLENRWFIKDEKKYIDDSTELIKDFKQSYRFFNEIIDSIFQYNIEIIEVWLSDSLYSVHCKEDFCFKITNREQFLDSLFSSLEDKEKNSYNYTFKSTIFQISK